MYELGGIPLAFFFSFFLPFGIISQMYLELSFLNLYYNLKWKQWIERASGWNVFPSGPHIVVYILGLLVFLAGLLIALYIYGALKNSLTEKKTMKWTESDIFHWMRISSNMKLTLHTPSLFHYLSNKQPKNQLNACRVSYNNRKHFSTAQQLLWFSPTNPISV